MNRKNNASRPLFNKKKVKSKVRKAPTRRNRRPNQGGGQFGKYALMLADPCNAVLEPGFNGTDEGIMSRLKTSYTNTGTVTNGYLLWCPIYVGGNNAIAAFFYADADASAPVINTIASPLGSGSDSGINLDVGATAFVTSDTVSDFRLISACIKATYIGALQDSAGLIACVENLPIDTFLLGQATLDGAASVDDLFALSSNVKRFGPDTHEIRYRNTGSESFKLDTYGVMLKGTAASTRTTLTPEAERFAPTMYGFAWKGVPSNKIAFDFIQNIEWRPETRAGFVSVIPRQLNPPGYARSVMSWLDKHHPGWTTAVKKTASTGLLNLASSVFSGAISRSLPLLL